MPLFIYMIPVYIDFLKVFEDEPASVDITAVITAINSAVTPAQVATLMAQIVGAGTAIYLTWIFGRKAIGGMYRAIRGKAPIRG